MDKTKKFIAKARKVHGDKYDYPNSKYKNCKEKVAISCPAHGEFYSTPDNHLRGKGCPDCGGTKKMTTQDFINKAIEVHGNAYDYSKSKYTASRHKLEILCKEHGRFWQTANSHLCGHGCPNCRNELISATQRKDTKWFVERAEKMHGNCYDYSLVNYRTMQDKVTIICKKHGKFEQLANTHLRGGTCLKCAVETREYNPNSAFGIAGYYNTSLPSSLYVVKLGDSCIKVGLSKDITNRLKVLSRQSGHPVEMVCSIQGPANKLFRLERKIIFKSGLKRHYPEESFSGSTECLELSELPKILGILDSYISSV